MCENNGDGNARERDGALARLSSTKHVLIESFYAAAEKETVNFFSRTCLYLFPGAALLGTLP